jgi:[acyl-carrier-protein] S-malonyltransferase
LISKRSLLMQQVCDAKNTGMAVITGLYDIIVKDICKQVEGVVVPANYNALRQVVISGDNEAIKKVCEKLSPAASRIVKLQVSGAFHSPFMSSIVDEYKAALDETEFKTPICPVYQNINGRPFMDTELIKKNLIGQLTQPVMWRHAILHMEEDGATEFTEIGPGNFLKELTLQIHKDMLVNGIN